MNIYIYSMLCHILITPSLFMCIEIPYTYIMSSGFFFALLQLEVVCYAQNNSIMNNKSMLFNSHGGDQQLLYTDCSRVLFL